MTEYNVRNKILVEKLNTVDEIREHLTQLAGNDQLFMDQIMSNMPQFVVVGAQSSGKSSVLKRISNNSIKLPEAADICTKVPTVLKLRRACGEDTSVSVIGPDAQLQKIDVRAQDSDAIRDAIAIAQELAMQKCPGKTFAEDYSIEVKITKETLPNVTLIDLPGFTNKSDESAKTVNEMVQKQVSMPGSLVLHVCKSDQDQDTILGNDFLRNIDKDKILVLTHTDRLSLFEPKDFNARVEATVRATGEPRFAVIGNHTGTFEDEERKLRSHACIASRPEIIKGSASLNVLIEKEISAHLETQIPKARHSLEQELMKTIKRLDVIKEVDATTVIFQAVSEIKEFLQNFAFECENELRKQQEVFAKQIQNISIQDLSGIEFTEKVKLTSNHKKYLIRGMTIFTNFEKNYSIVLEDDYTRDNRELHNIELTYPVLNNKQSNTPLPNVESEFYNTLYNDENKFINKTKALSNMCINYGPVNEIKALSAERGMRNVFAQDKQRILVIFAERFAKKYTEINLDNLNATYKYLKASFLESFLIDLPPATKHAISKLQNMFEDEFSQLFDEAEAEIMKIKEWNLAPLCYSVNESNMSNEMKFVGQSSSNDGKDDQAFTIMFEIEAQLEIQIKAIVEASTKMILLVLQKKGMKSLINLLKENMSNVIRQVQEPDSIKSERESLIIRKKILDDCVKNIRKI